MQPPGPLRHFFDGGGFLGGDGGTFGFGVSPAVRFGVEPPDGFPGFFGMSRPSYVAFAMKIARKTPPRKRATPAA